MAARNSYYYYYYDGSDLSPAQVLPPPPPAAPSLLSQYSDNLDSKISPSVLLIIAILAVIFFLSGLLHLLIRYLLRPTVGTDTEEAPDNVTALQGQLQQLFNLHDAGVDQSYIDTLPVFLYKAVVGVKGPFDCAVCLCEFEPDDKLRLLPRCSHAFHIECIDTWLLSHSTCPLCRGSLLAAPDFVTAPVISSYLAGLELHGGESSREIVNVPDQAPEEQIKEEPVPEPTKVVAVKLGKFRNLDPAAIEGGNGGGTSSNLDGRRCFSMGSFEYVMDEKSQLQVAINPPEKKKKKKHGESHGTSTMKARQSRLAMSECDCHSQRENFRGLLGVAPAKRESFSFSKTWRKEKQGPKSSGDDSRRLSSSSSSFRIDPDRPKRSKEEPSHTISSEFDSCSEFDMDVEIGSCNNGRVLSRREETPSFARRTLLWVIARNQNHKVVNHI